MPYPDDTDYQNQDTDSGIFSDIPTDEIFEDTEVCPNCHKPITSDMDSCPYCGDILYRYLKDGQFIPQKGPLAKLVAWLIILLVLLGVLGLLLTQLLP